LEQTAPLSRFAGFLAAFLLVGLAACAVALAPGYTIRKESREVRYSVGPPAALQIHARYELENSGTADLDFVDVNLPEARAYGRRDLRVEVDGQQATVEALPADTETESIRVRFDSSWKRGQSRELTMEYQFVAPEDSGARITLGERNFHLGSRGWLPLPQPPKHLLSPYPRRPDRVDYTVRVPSDFRILARGSPAKKKQNGNEMEYRFELRKNDLTPYVVAGLYAASPDDPKSTKAVFWTFQPLTQNPAPAVEKITAAWDVLVKDFGPLDKNIGRPHVVESTGLRGHITGEVGPAAAAFPGGVLVNSDALAQGIDTPQFLESVAHELAHNWFGDEVFFEPNTALGMGEGLPEYATIVIDESLKGDSARRDRVGAFLREYDDARSRGAEKPLGITTLADPTEERKIALAKAPLFYVALEDACGAQQMQAGVARMLKLLRGQVTSYNALRSTLEEASGKDLAELFRVWLNDKNVPRDFRDRYQNRASGP
jgi:hypothetical protein